MYSGITNVNGTEADPSLFLFSDARREHAKQFLDDLHSCENAPTRQRLCQEKRDELLAQKHDLKVEFAFYKSVFVRWIQYGVTEHGPEWKEFATAANEGADNQTLCAKELKKAASYWGEDIVQHYIEGRGASFAMWLARVAKVHRDFQTEALPRLQQLIRRRIQLDRRNFKHAIERIDLTNAKSWTSDASYVKLNDHEKIELPFSNLKPSELPNGYVFDLYGLIVPGQSTVEVSKALHTTDQPSSIVESTKIASSVPTSQSEGPVQPGISRACVTTISNSNDSPDASSAPTNLPSNGQVKCMQSAVHDSPTCITEPATQVPHEKTVQTEFRRSNRIAADKQAVYESAETTLRRTSRTTKTKTPNVESRNHQPKGIESSSDTLDLVLERISQLAGELDKYSSLEEVSVAPDKRRATSVPLDVGKTHKRLCDQTVIGPRGFCPDALPHCDSASDQVYLAQAVSEVSQRAKDATGSRGARTAACLLPILKNCKHPNTDANCGALDLHLMSGVRAKKFLDSNAPDVPLITEGQQIFEWDNREKAIAEFFEWIGDDDKTVSVQIPSLEADGCSCEVRNLGQVRNRFLSLNNEDDPWNVLDCSCPMPSTLPSFLTGRNCQLLGRIRDQVLNGHSAERAQVSRDDWSEWKDIEHWALLSEGGHCTAPHMDSHGLATWITVQQGSFGFVWMSRPTGDQRREWMKDIEHYNDDQRWRYWILKPGQTVYFPSGTIHGVFRLREEQTLALGGHILQWSGINQWADVFHEQVRYPNSTNEDMESPSRWFLATERLVQNRLGQSTRD
ncbi:unnamed protein product [Clonostachys byssicola]|uniref:JmjC domain-containing protein n=1 Tax=Clonostachys byssicola TaxID=160290 RepID=A0A9N9UQ37_9HYPO|nr:unnamed protein product [Clonostachys byssicola]